MNILFLAPHPFYQDRGSPIAVNLMLRVLSDRGDHVDVVTYHEGHSVDHRNIKIHRIPNIPFVRDIQPGPSFKKFVCDVVMLFKVLRLAVSKRYDLVHSVEESVFMALIIETIFGPPYLFDMDSCLSEQMIDKYPVLGIFGVILYAIEGYAVKKAIAVAVVCQSLSKRIEKYKPKKVVVVEDPSLLIENGDQPQMNIRTELDLKGLVIMYAGNLASYQGIDLLLSSFALLKNKTNSADLVIIGGEVSHIKMYQNKSSLLNISDRVHFLGPKPIAQLYKFLSQADILVSPRLKGENTPMKLYSYLHSGKPVVATDLVTHTQILNSKVSVLKQPVPEDFSGGILKLIEDKSLRDEIGIAGRKYAEEHFTEAAFRMKVLGLYDWVEKTIQPRST